MKTSTLQSGLQDLNCRVTNTQISQLENYIDLLVRWNKVYNLTAISNINQILPLHIFDSLTVIPHLHNKNYLDVGSGGGLPGIPLAILKPEWSFTLLDSVGKKTRFMQQAVIQLNLPNVRVVHTRVESWTPDIAFDAIISRAFASLADFVKLTGQHLHQQGSFYAMKGRHPAEEIANLPQDYRVIATHKLAIPQRDVDRYLIEIKHN